ERRSLAAHNLHLLHGRERTSVSHSHDCAVWIFETPCNASWSVHARSSNKISPGRTRGFKLLEVREKRSVLCDDRSIPVEFVVHADQHGLHARSIDESLTRNVGRGRVEVLREIILGPDVVPLREHRPVWRKHPFAADAGGESGLPEG